MVLMFAFLIDNVDQSSLDDHQGLDQRHVDCSQSSLAHCSDLLTRALDKHDLGFVTTEQSLDSLCRSVVVKIVIIFQTISHYYQGYDARDRVCRGVCH